MGATETKMATRRPRRMKKPNPNDPLTVLFNSIRCENTEMCTGYLTPPIFICKNEHSVCATCLELYQPICPICKDEVTMSRITQLETISNELLVSCKNLKKGCNFKFPKQEISRHQSECSYSGNFTCFSSRCKWTSDLPELVIHIETCHKERFYKDPVLNFSIKKMSTRRGNYDNMAFISCSLGHFWTKFIYKEDEEQFYGAVQYLGPKQEAEKLDYKIEIIEKDDNGEFTGLKCVYTGIVNTHIESFNDIFDDQECFIIKKDFSQYFTHNDVLDVELKIITAP